MRTTYRWRQAPSSTTPRCAHANVDIRIDRRRIVRRAQQCNAVFGNEEIVSPIRKERTHSHQKSVRTAFERALWQLKRTNSETERIDERLTRQRHNATRLPST